MGVRVIFLVFCRSSRAFLLILRLSSDREGVALPRSSSFPACSCSSSVLLTALREDLSLFCWQPRGEFKIARGERAVRALDLLLWLLSLLLLRLSLLLLLPLLLMILFMLLRLRLLRIPWRFHGHTSRSLGGPFLCSCGDTATMYSVGIRSTCFRGKAGGGWWALEGRRCLRCRRCHRRHRWCSLPSKRIHVGPNVQETMKENRVSTCVRKQGKETTIRNHILRTPSDVAGGIPSPDRSTLDGEFRKKATCMHFAPGVSRRRYCKRRTAHAKRNRHKPFPIMPARLLDV